MHRFNGPLAREWGLNGQAEALRAALIAPSEALGVPDSRDRAFWKGRDSATLTALITRASADLDQPWPIPTAHDYARYVLDGDRDAYQDQVFARQDRVAAAVLAAAATDEEAFVREALNGLILLCEQSSWCWPAHDDAAARHGSILSDVTDPFLDLGASEVVVLLAWADGVLGPRLESRYPGLRDRLRLEADRRVFGPFLVRRDWWWLGLDRPPINWSAWIQGNVLTSALRLVDDPLRRARIVDSALEGLDRFLASIPPDGAIDEGSAYWWEGAGRLLEALERLDVATGGTLDASGIPVLKQLVEFPVRMQLGDDWTVNFSDAPARTPDKTPWRTLFHWARATGARSAEALARSHRASKPETTHECTGRNTGPREHEGSSVGPLEAGLARLIPALADHDWTTASSCPAEPPLSTWLPSIQVSVDRNLPRDAHGLTLAIKGGTNGESHNHNDVGSFIVALDGAPVLIDVGQPTYTAQTFGPDRYAIWVTQSPWHNVPLIRGTAQADGAQWSARNVHRIDEGSVAGLRLDLSGAYPRTDIRSWNRRAVLDRSTPDFPFVTITDAWEFDEVPALGTDDTEVHLLVAGWVTPLFDGVRIMTPSSTSTVSVSWTPVPSSVSIEECPVTDPRLSAVWGPTIHRIVLVPQGAEEKTGMLNLTIRAEKQR